MIPLASSRLLSLFFASPKEDSSPHKEDGPAALYSYPLLSDWARSITLGNAALFRFWFSYLLEPFRSLPVELYDEQALAQRMAKGEAFDLTLPASYPKLYASGLSKLNAYIGSLCHGVPAEPMTKQYLFWLARGATVVAACCGSFASLLLASLLQFLFLPYSTFVAIAYGLETVFTLYTGHALVFPLLSLAVRAALPPWLNPTLTLDARFLALFLLVDHAFCAVCLGWTPKGTPKPVPTRRVLASMAYGFLNCKTYYLVLLPACFGLELELLPWLLDASLGLSARVSGHLERYWQVHFYHIHRMGHITNVYNDAHKFHHYLHDCTPFDAHIFGSGGAPPPSAPSPPSSPPPPASDGTAPRTLPPAPEEWLILMSDLALGLGFGLQPASLSGHVLGVSWYNKCFAAA